MSGVNESVRKIAPPLGLRPRHIADEVRLNEIRAAVRRYLDFEDYALPIPEEWIKEHNEIIYRICERDTKRVRKSDYINNHLNCTDRDCQERNG